MTQVIIVYGSTTGNTAAAAKGIGKLLEQVGYETKLYDAADVTPDALWSNDEVVLLGCSSWGNGVVALQYDFVSLYEALDYLPLENCRFACFGSGDRTRSPFCGAVDAIEEKLLARGAKRLVKGLKLDGEPESAIVAVWVQTLLTALE